MLQEIEFITEQLGLELAENPLLGRGVFGTAYLLKDGRVLKITDDDQEAVCSASIADKQNTPEWLASPAHVHIPYIDQLGKTPYHEYYYIREELEDLRPDDWLPMDQIISAYIDQWMMSSLEIETTNWNDRRTVRLVLSHWWDYHDAQGLGIPKPFQTIDEEISHELGLKFNDLHFWNWGLRKSTGELVIRDLSCSEV